ncbi:MAG: DUF177 domain-containing protein [Deltaproteobacteria bacterium]|nr:DUF177 domain-containing protein [Deltaproteobacteria bacterium]MBW2360372.1 DUF177 domain-containing protein [Deltaproteobacteria bacterium]
MRLLVERFEETPVDFAFEADSAWWRSSVPASPGLPAALDEPLHFALRGYCIGDDLLVEGSLEGRVPLECSRCLARYRHDLREAFRLLLEPAGSRLPADPEAAEALERDGLCLGEDIETGWYRGLEIDLGPFLREVVMTALPVKSLCREDCAGLCPRCGGDRNQVACDCPEFQKPSPFAVLETLRDGLRKGES